MTKSKKKRLFHCMALISLTSVHSQSYAVNYSSSTPLEGSDCTTFLFTVCYDSSTINAAGETTYLSAGTEYTTAEFYNNGNLWGPGALYLPGDTKIKSSGVFLNSGNIRGITEFSSSYTAINTGAIEANVIYNSGLFNNSGAGKVSASLYTYNYGTFLNSSGNFRTDGLSAGDLLNASIFVNSGFMTSNEVFNYNGNISNSGTLRNKGDFDNTGTAVLKNDGVMITKGIFTNHLFGLIENNNSHYAGVIDNAGTFKNAGDLTYETINNYGVFSNSGDIKSGNTFNNFGDFSTSGKVSAGKAFNNDGKLTINENGVFNNIFYTVLTNNSAGKIIVEGGGALTNNPGSELINEGGTLKINGAGNLTGVGKLTNGYIGTILNKNGGKIDSAGNIDNHGIFINEIDSEVINSGLLTIYGLNYDKGEAGGRLINKGGFVNKGFFTIHRDNNFENVFINSGTFDNELMLINGSSVTNASGGVVNNKGSLQNYGVFENQGSINNTGEILNKDYLMNAGTIVSYKEFNNDGTLENRDSITNSGYFSNSGIINNSGTITNTQSIYGIGTLTQTAGEIINNGTISQAKLNINGGSFSGSGDISGTVTIGSNGSINPGNSPGTLTINGNFTNHGLFTVELGGLKAGEYDVLNVHGIANLGGTLDVQLYDLGKGLFAPSLGDTFDILSADVITGDFDFLKLALLGNGLSWKIDYLYDQIGTTDIARLNVVATSSVPIPSAIWFFGTGLVGGIGLTRRKAR